MGRKKYHGPINTVEHAFMAHAVLKITCLGCGREVQMFAWRIYEAAKDKIVGMPLNKPIPGWRCKMCRQSVRVVIRYLGDFDYGT